jgi:hypothetical protein
VRKWQSQDINNYSIDKAKHVHFDIEGSSPETLHLNAGSKENAEAILAKLKSSKALSQTSNPLPETRKPSVHFSSASPTMIPPPSADSSEDEPEAEEVATEEGEAAVALYAFAADQDDEMSVSAGEPLIVLEKDEEWWKCRNADGKEGVVPASYVEVCIFLFPAFPRLNYLAAQWYTTARGGYRRGRRQ